MTALMRRTAAEFVGTALLLIAVVGSGIAAHRLSPGNTGLQLLESAIAIGGALAAIIIAIGPVSGAHLNPVVSLVERPSVASVTWNCSPTSERNSSALWLGSSLPI